MRINTSTHYAICIMLHLAERGKTVSSADMASNLNISQRYILQVAAKLRDGGMAGVTIGLSGGYYLLKDPIEISLYDILTLMESGAQIAPLLEKADCTPLQYVYAKLQSRFETVCRSLTLDILALGGAEGWQKTIDEAIMRTYEIQSLT